eukprot:1549149-Prymnesium_polylepis.1
MACGAVCRACVVRGRPVRALATPGLEGPLGGHFRPGPGRPRVLRADTQPAAGQPNADRCAVGASRRGGL